MLHAFIHLATGLRADGSYEFMIGHAYNVQDALRAARKQEQRRQHKSSTGIHASGKSSSTPHVVSGGISKRFMDIGTTAERIARLRLGAM